MKQIVSAVYETREGAERALAELRASGVPDDAISVIAKEPPRVSPHDARVQRLDEHDTKASGLAKGLVTGGIVGALFGLSAILIPGVGPFVTAGALAQVLGTTAGAAASGAIVGGTAGGMSGLLMDYGVGADDAKFYEQRLHEGAYFIAIDTGQDSQNEEMIKKIVNHTGGRSSGYLA